MRAIYVVEVCTTICIPYIFTTEICVQITLIFHYYDSLENEFIMKTD